MTVPFPIATKITACLLGGLLVATGGPEARENPSTPADTTAGTLLQRLQEEDRQFYSRELFQVDPGLRDSALSALSDLGIQEYLKQSRRRRPLVDFDLEPAGRLIAYNRVEAVVAGLRAHFALRSGITVEGEAAYATAPQKLRHLEVLRIPLRLGGRRTRLEFGYADRVVPYGSNRPPGNGLRALFGSADEQDYLRRRGSWITADFQMGRHRSLTLGYRRSHEFSVRAQNDFGLFGNPGLLAFNAPITEGLDQGMDLGVSWGSLAETRNALEVRHRFSIGDLGGNFTYVRTDALLSTRRYVPGNHELTVDVAFVETGGQIPVQHRADIGGLSTVRGYDRRSRVGARSLALRAEMLLPYNLLGLTPLRGLRLQAVPWVDAGRVWEGASPAWIAAAGVGVQRYLGPFGSGAFLRLDAAVPLGPDRPEDLRLYLRFARGLF